MFAQHRATEQEMKGRRGCHGNNWTEGGPGPERVEEPMVLLEFQGLGCLRKEGDIGIGRSAILFYYTLAVVRSSGGRIVGKTQSVNK